MRRLAIASLSIGLFFISYAVRFAEAQQPDYRFQHNLEQLQQQQQIDQLQREQEEDQLQQRLDEMQSRPEAQRKMLANIIRAFKKLIERGTSASMLLVVSGLLTGCAALGLEQTKPPVSVSEVIQMTEEGVPAETIIHKMRAAKSVYRLDAAE